ncbi:DUF4393 domain-containing protein [Pasteurella multocida]|uniref:DUF4393 domain-containing protein n=1 Tax=Pasteurella multocida TaxID=747 RepID=UPI0013F3C8A8|nr:DUF4393 domain-containing protein [Pasteurella multocida]
MNEYYPIISGALSGMAAAGALKGPIESLTQIWTLTLGRFFDNSYQKYKIKQAADLEKYAKEVAENIEKIPEENIKEPKISVIGPALEASKFYMEEDEIRRMFAKLIASSMDKSQSDNIHPSFVEMIKMLSPLDAQNLYYLYHNGDETISTLRTTISETGGYTDHYKHFFLGNPECQDISLIEPSIDNLIRLKLVDVTYNAHKSDDSLYNKYRESPIFLNFKSEIETEQRSLKASLEYLINGGELAGSSPEQRSAIIENLKQACKDKEVGIQKGIIRLTALGRNFCKVCL